MTNPIVPSTEHYVRKVVISKSIYTTCLALLLCACGSGTSSEGDTPVIGSANPDNVTTSTSDNAALVESSAIAAVVESSDNAAVIEPSDIAAVVESSDNAAVIESSNESGLTIAEIIDIAALAIDEEDQKGSPEAPAARLAESPAGLNEDLPMMGMFYGHPAAFGKSPGNTTKKARHFIRFRATRSLPIDEAEFDVRIGPGYSSGTGGVIKYMIFSDDGSINHFPDVNDVYGESDSTFVPGDLNRNVGYAKAMNMTNVRSLTAGRLYHLGIINLDPSSGRIPMNGSIVIPQDTEQYKSWERETQGPWFSQGASWALSDNGRELEPLTGVDVFQDIQPWFAIKYSDGTWEGTYYTNSDYPVSEPYDSSIRNPADTKRELAWVDGKYAASQPFTVTQQSRVVDGLWTHYGHHKNGGTPNGAPLKAELLDSEGSVLATVNYQPDWPLYQTTLSENATGDSNLDYRLNMAGDWKYQPFSEGRSTSVVLEVGRSYSVRYTSDEGGNYTLRATPSVSLSDPELATRDRNNFLDGDAARRSSDGGQTFPKEVDWGPRSWGGKLGMLFTIKGQVQHGREHDAAN